jgi:sortase A
MSKRLAHFVERLLLVAGVALVATYCLARVEGWYSSRQALRTFDEAVAAQARPESSGVRLMGGEELVDFHLWSEKRIRDYQESLLVEKRLPWAVLAIGKVGIRVPVFDGTDDLVLNRGVGWISGTARPGDAGNIGLAGHRDGFFRGLKDITGGDVITLTTPQEQADYVVDEIEIVTPDRVDVLAPRGKASITLVTCYPFYFVGDAPQRFIVHASLTRTVATSAIDVASR